MATKVRHNQRWERVDKSDAPLEKLIYDFLLAKRSSGCSEATVVWYRNVLGLFQAFLANNGYPTTLATFCVERTREFTVHLQGRRAKYENNPFRKASPDGLSSHTVFSYVAGLRAFATWLHEDGYTDRHSLEGLKPPKKRKKVVSALTPDEMKQLLGAIPANTAAGSRDRALLMTLLDTGLRASEICGLSVDDAHIAEGYLKVLRKGDKERIVPHGTLAARALLRYRDHFRPLPAGPRVRNLFLTADGLPLTRDALRSVVRRWAAKAGIAQINVHKLRHTFALQYLTAGGDAFSLQKILGHTTLEMTRNYVNMLPSHVIEKHRLYSPMDQLAGALPSRRSRKSA